MKVAAVTGTNGKTSVVEYARQLASASGLSAASYGTLGLVDAAGDRHVVPTLEGADGTRRFLEHLAASGVEVVFLEAYSKVLRDGLLDGVPVGVAGFTTLSDDHLDVHEDLRSYALAKLRLFTEVVDRRGTAVINLADPFAPEVVEASRLTGVTTWGTGPGGVVQFHQDVRGRDRLGGTLLLGGAGHDVSLPVWGDYQVHNLLVALGMAWAAGADPARLSGAVGGLTPPAGRQWRVDLPTGGQVVVDYAHNPGGLDAVLGSLREQTRGWLVVVLGAGGGRDRGKREEMGRVAATHADVVVVTDDNPRHEDPAAIRADIRRGCPDAYDFAGRADAIDAAIELIGPGDVLVVAGKGEEDAIEVGDRRVAHSDVEHVRRRLWWVPSIHRQDDC